MVLCLLFITIELLCNDLDRALGHLQGGLRIAAMVRSRANSIGRSDSCLLHALIHLQAQGRIHSSPTSDFNWTTVDVDLSPNEYPKAFRNNGEARNELDSISASMYSVFRRCRVAEHSGRLSGSRTCAQTEVLKMDLVSLTPGEIQAFTTDMRLLKERLFLWEKAFEQLERSAVDDDSTGCSVALAILKIQHHCMFIILSTVFETGETCYDAFTPRFQEIITLAERVLDSQAYQNFSFFFSFAPLLPNLFFTGMKCRVATLRLAVLRLLSRCPTRQGFWHRESLLRLVQWKYAIECSREDTLLPESQQPHNDQQEKAEGNGESIIHEVYKLSRYEESKVLDVKDDTNGRVIIGDKLF